MSRKILTALLLTILITFPIDFSFAEEEYTEGFLKYVHTGESVTITGYFGNEDELVIPSSIAGMPVNRIAANAFAKSGLKKIYLPDTIMVIENGAFPDHTEVIFSSNTNHIFSKTDINDYINNPKISESVLESSPVVTQRSYPDNQSIISARNNFASSAVVLGAAILTIFIIFLLIRRLR